MPTASTRAEILEFIRQRQIASPSEIASAVNLTGAAIRYHLANLGREGLIEAAPHPVSERSGRGRPAQYFRLSDRTSANNWRLICQILLNGALTGSEWKDSAPIWQSLARQLAEPIPQSRRLNQKLAEAVEKMNQLNHSARWEAGPRGPRILLANCPYAPLISTLPGFCEMDQTLLGLILGRKVKQTQKMAPPAARNSCIFELLN